MNRQQKERNNTVLHYLDENGQLLPMVKELDYPVDNSYLEYEQILIRDRKTSLANPPEIKEVSFQEIKQGINIDSKQLIYIILFSGLVFLVYSFLKFIVISLLIIVLFFLMFQMSRIPAPRRSSLTRQDDFVKRQNVNVNNNIRSSGANVNVTTNVNVK